MARLVRPSARKTPRVQRALDDGERHRAVDEKHADDEREQTEGSEVRAKCRGQRVERARVRLDRYQHRAGGRIARELFRLRAREREIDAADASVA